MFSHFFGLDERESWEGGIKNKSREKEQLSFSVITQRSCHNHVRMCMVSSSFMCVSVCVYMCHFLCNTTIPFRGKRGTFLFFPNDCP